MARQTNALSIDLEEWYHPQIIRKYVKLPKKKLVWHSTQMLLNLLKRYNTKATFFILGEVAKQNPELIRKIYCEGHEIASHGFSHKMLHEIGPEGLRNELREFKKVISEILGDIEIKGFRAPTFSLNQDTSWAVDILKEFKIKYDSSIFPIKFNLFGVNGAPIKIYGLNSRDIKSPDDKSTLMEFPITVYETKGIRLPVSGGFFLRLIPINLQKKNLRLINTERPFIIYIHPWECDITTPQLKMNPLHKFISYYNIKYTLIKLESLLNYFDFDRIDNILKV
jgi:polysaccharide deacetylase family protein (PEP-CTERM system associated)